MKNIDGKKIADEIIKKLPKKQKKIAFVLVGDNKESQMYIEMKEKMARKVGVEVLHCKPPASVEKEELKQAITALSKHVDGIMVQLPLPQGLQEDTQEILDCIDPAKDIDALHTNTQYVSPFIQSIVESCMAANVLEADNQKVMILARSEVFKKRLSDELKKKGLEDITTAESFEDNLHGFGIVISVLGIAGEITSRHIDKNTICIDAGLKVVNQRARGDFHSDSNEKAAAKTPVPGGVGPLTIACLFRNLINQ